VAAVYDELRAIDALFSPYRPDSQVRRLDRAELAIEDAHPLVSEVVGLCETARILTGGSFDAWRPADGGRRSFDPTGLVKGWAVQRAADILREGGATTFCVNAGGDVVTAGEPETGKPWRVGVRHPDIADQLCVVLGVRDGAVATSALYERGRHILDGRTGNPVTGILSVTVFADDLAIADTTATAAFALGRDGIEWAASQEDCEVFIVDEDRRVFRSPGLPVHIC
jgi:thiamine biosynthesis lipoprotein